MAFDALSKKILWHSGFVALLVAIVLGAAIGLDFLEHWGAEKHMSPWLLQGIGALAKFLFWTDFCFLCIIVPLGALHLIREAIEKHRPKKNVRRRP